MGVCNSLFLLGLTFLKVLVDLKLSEARSFTTFSFTFSLKTLGKQKNL